MPLFSIINLFIFQASWFSAALLKDSSIIIMLLLLVAHAYFSPKKQADLYTMLLVLPIGLASEVLMIATGLLSYQSELILPIWMVLLWMHLGLSLNHSLSWLQKVPWIWQSVLAGLAGAGSYAAAANLGAINMFNPQVFSLMVIAGIWAIQFPLMMKVAKHVNQRGSAWPIYK